MPALDWTYLLIGAIVSVATFVLSIVVVAWVLISLPATFFLRRGAKREALERHPATRWLWFGIKNAAGLVLILIGIVLSLPGVPGQGLLLILIGLLLMDIPGTHRLQRAILGRPGVLQKINALRARFHRPPLVLVEDEGGGDQQ